MRWKILVTVIAGLALGACETTSDNAGSAQGGGSATGQGSSLGSGGISSPQVSSLAPGGVTAGSQEDLVTNIGDRVFFGLAGISLLAEARATLEKQAQ